MTAETSDVLTVVDTTRIQSYIYRSNRLAENVGASHLVHLATHEWVNELREVHDGEAISSAGGNAIMVFPNREKAKAFARALSRRAIESAPGLQLRVAHVDYDTNAFLGDVIAEGIQALKTQRVPRSEPVLGLGVTVMCQSTALPATKIVGEGANAYPAATSIKAKIHDTYRDSAEEQLQSLTGLHHDYTFPRDFDKIGRTKDDNSTLAVIHADGNGIGQLVGQIADSFRKEDGSKMTTEEVVEANALYLPQIRKFSKQLTEATQKAIEDTVQSVVDWLESDSSNKDETEKRLISQMKHNTDEEDRLILPLRPLIIGGDDVTLVCDGRLGVSLARIYLEKFAHYAENIEYKFKKENGDPLEITACAGAAIVKVHYPFARAYDLADELCSNAKKRFRREGKRGSYLDWHFAVSGMVSTDLDDIRKRLYQIQGNKLTLRPVVVKPEHLRSWDVVDAGLKKFQPKTQEEKKEWPRSKRKALQEALLGGQETTGRWIAVYGDNANLPEHPQLEKEKVKNGFVELDFIQIQAA